MIWGKGLSTTSPGLVCDKKTAENARQTLQIKPSHKRSQQRDLETLEDT